METERQCSVCGKMFPARHHAARYCKSCRQGIIDGIIPASATVRWNLRHPAERLNAVKHARGKKLDLYNARRRDRRKDRPNPAYQHSYYEHVTKPKRAGNREKGQGTRAGTCILLWGDARASPGSLSLHVSTSQ